jgi:hypothetical protein
VWCKFGPPVRLAFIAAWNERADQDHSKHKNLPCFVKYGGDISLNSDRSLNSKKSSFLVMGTAMGTGIWRVKILVPVPVPVAVPVQYTMQMETDKMCWPLVCMMVKCEELCIFVHSLNTECGV